MKESDPEGYRAEVLGEFLAGVPNLIDGEAIDRCLRGSPTELPPVPAIRYEAFVDPSASLTGAGADGREIRRLAGDPKSPKLTFGT